MKNWDEELADIERSIRAVQELDARITAEVSMYRILCNRLRINRLLEVRELPPARDE